jgi:hypothetical protein
VFYHACITHSSTTEQTAIHNFSTTRNQAHYDTYGHVCPGTRDAPVPPQNLDAEESVLGAMMLSPLAIGAVTELTNLSAADFYRESHGHIYKAILALYAKGEPVDAITVVDELDRTQALDAAGGQERVHELATLVPAASNARTTRGSSARWRRSVD